MSELSPLIEIGSEELADFHRDGAVLLKKVLKDEWIELLEE